MKAKKILAFLISAVMAAQSIPVYTSAADEKIVENKSTEPTAKNDLLTETIIYNENEFLTDDTITREESPIESELKITEDVLALYADASVVASGYCGGEGDGTNLTWELDSAGVLTINGTGRMMDWEHRGIIPWYDVQYSITNIDIAYGITNIGSYAFAYCRNLTNVTIPGSINRINKSAFEYCTSLNSVTLNEGIQTIGDSAFSDCSNLQTIMLPNTLSVIEFYAFGNCTSLETIYIPASVRRIVNNAFSHCSSLNFIDVDDNSEYFTNDEYGVLYTKNYSRLLQFPINNGVSNYEVAGNTTYIEKWAFAENTYIQRIFLPNTLTEIDNYAFYKCSQLSEINLPQSLTTLGESAFRDCNRIKNISLPENLSGTLSNTFSGCTSLKSVIIPSKIEELSFYSFGDCTSIKAITITSPVIKIIGWNFSDCVNLETICIYATDPIMGSTDEFENCRSLQAAYFHGNAPIQYDRNPIVSKLFGNTDSSFTIYYKEGTSGWTDSEAYDTEKGTWNGYKLEVWEDDSNDEPSTITTYTHFGQYNGCTTASTIDPVTGLRLKRAETATIDGVTYPVSDSFDNSANILDIAFPGNWLDNYYYIAYSFNDANEITSACVMEGTICQLEGWDPENRVIDTDYTPLIFVGSDDSWRTLPLGEYYVSDLTLDSFPINEIGNWVGDDVRIYWAGETIYKIIHIAYGSGTITAFDPLSTPQKVYIDNVAYSLASGNDELVRAIVAGQFLDVQYILYDSTIIAVTSISETFLEVSITNNGSFFVGDDFHVYIYDCTEFSDGTVIYSYPAHWSVRYEQYNGIVMEDVDIIEHKNYLEFVFKAIAPGTAVLYISDYVTKDTIEIALTMADDVYKSYRANNVPTEVYDIYVDKDYYNYYLGGMYLADFNYDKLETGSHMFNFNIFNESYIPGVVEVYEADGTLSKIYTIDKYKEKSTSLLGTGEYIVDGVVDLFQGDSLSFRGDIQSKESNYAIEVPQDGYILVTNSGSVSDACFLMNAIDLFWEISSLMMDTASYNPEMVDDIVAEILKMARKNELAKDFLRKFMEDFAKESAVSISDEYLLKLYTNISKNLMELFTMLDIDFVKLGISAGVGSGMGVLQDLLVKASGPAGIALDAVFHFSKITNLVTQIVQWCKIDDNNIGAVIYTPRADASNTIHNTKDGISATLSNGNTFSANTVLQTYKMTGNIELTDTLPLESTDEFIIYNISLVENGNPVSIEDEITVHISRPSLIDNVRAVLLYTDNEWVTVPFSVASDTITVQTSLLGKFAVLGENIGISGTCGDNATWTLTKDGTLTISGTGTVYDYNSTSPAPWYTYRIVIKQVIVEESVERLGAYAFLDLINVKNIQLAEGILGFGDCAFHNCRSLEVVNLPASLDFGAGLVNAFQGCTSLENVYIPSSNEFYESRDGVIISKYGGAIVVYPAGKTETSYAIPSGITSISGWAFTDCTSLEQVIIPESVTEIYIWAFSDCTNLKSVYFKGDVPTIWRDGIFNNTSSDLTLYYQKGNPSGWDSPIWTAPDGLNYNTSTWESSGDVDGDGILTNRDVDIIKQYFAGGLTYAVLPESADVDIDGKVTRRDAMILARHLAGWEGYTLPYRVSSLDVLNEIEYVRCCFSTFGGSPNGYNDSGESVNWNLQIRFSHEILHTYIDDLRNIKISTSWTDQLVSDSSWDKAKSGITQITKTQSTVYDGTQLWTINILLPDDPIIAGEQFVLLSLHDRVLKISFNLTYNGDYKTGSGWSISDVRY